MINRILNGTRHGMWTRLVVLLILAVVFMGMLSTALSGGPTTNGTDPTLAATPTMGMMRVIAFQDRDGDRRFDPDELPVAGLSVLVSKVGQPVASGQTDALGICHLAAAPYPGYDVSGTAPAGYEILYPPVNPVIAPVVSGETTELVFVLRSMTPQATPTVTSTATDTLTPSVTPTYAATPTATAPALQRKELVLQYQVSGYPRCSGDDCYISVADTFLDAWAPDQAQTTNSVLQMKGSRGAGEIKVPLLQFDLFRIPQNARVISATLSLWSEYRAGSESVNVGAYELLQPVVASQATWRHRLADVTWAGPGGNGIGTDRAAVATDTDLVSDTNLWYQWDLTALVTKWVADPAVNHGIVLKPTGTLASDYEYRFSASWSTVKDHRPKLTIVYEAAPTVHYERFGLGLVGITAADPTSRRRISDYDMDLLQSTWYSDWWYNYNPRAPEGMQYVHLARVRDMSWETPFFWDGIAYAASRQPGSIWIIGNEPEDAFQENCTPAKFAERYYTMRQFILEYDPTAIIAIGGLVEPTPIRLRWLDMVMAEYERRYGEPLPCDIWTIHMQILPEEYPRLPVGVDDLHDARVYSKYENAGFATFVDLIREFRQWMADRGQRHKPLYISEYGVLYPSSMLNEWRNTDYGNSILKDFMTLTFDYLQQATDSELGYPADDNKLVQRWLWYSLNDHPYDPVSGAGFNGSLFAWQDSDYPGTLTQFGLHYVRYMRSLDDPLALDVVAQTTGGAGVTLSPQITLRLALTDPDRIQRIAISNEPGSLQIRQRFVAGEKLGDPPPNPAPLLLDQAMVLEAPFDSELDMPWDLAATIYGGNADYGTKTVYVRYQGIDGDWSRLFLLVVDYVDALPSATPTATWTGQPTATATLSPTVTPTPTITRTPTLNPSGTVTPTVTSTVTVTLTPSATFTIGPSMTPTPSPTPDMGQLCVRAFEDLNGDYLYQPGEPLIDGTTIIMMDTAFQVLAATSSSASEQTCFAAVKAGNYYLRQLPPAGFEAALSYFSVGVPVNQQISVSLPLRQR